MTPTRNTAPPPGVGASPHTGSLTSEFVQLSVDRVYDEHVRRLVALGHRGADQGQGAARLLALPLLVHEVVQLSQL